MADQKIVIQLLHQHVWSSRDFGSSGVYFYIGPWHQAKNSVETLSVKAVLVINEQELDSLSNVKSSGAKLEGVRRQSASHPS